MILRGRKVATSDPQSGAGPAVSVSRVTVGGDGVADPAGGGPGRPVGAAHGALAAPGGGAGPEGESLGLALLLCRGIIYFSLNTKRIIRRLVSVSLYL